MSTSQTNRAKDSAPENPYAPFQPAVGDGFAGRTDELRRMLQAVETKISLSVVGDLRIGKTSLLRALSSRVRASGRIVRELSGEGPEGESLAAFIKTLTGRDCPLQPANTGRKEPPSANPDAAAELLNAWAESNSQTALLPLLVLDEVERMIVAFDHRFFERLRGMLDRLVIVFCSRRELDLIYEELGRTSPFYNVLQQERVALLDSRAVEEIIGRGDGVLETEDGSAMRLEAGPHPHFLQLLGRELFEARLNDQSPNEAIDRFYDQAVPRLRDLWRTLNDRERDDLRTAAAGGAVTRRSLRFRGVLMENGQPFGRVVTEWLNVESP